MIVERRQTANFDLLQNYKSTKATRADSNQNYYDLSPIQVHWQGSEDSTSKAPELPATEAEYKQSEELYLATKPYVKRDTSTAPGKIGTIPHVQW